MLFRLRSPWRDAARPKWRYVIHRNPGGPKRLPAAAAVIALVALVCVSVFHPYPYDNAVTRWALAERLVQGGSLRIDPWRHMTGDKAEYGGHYYSDKSFMPSALAAVSALPLRLSGGLAGPSEYPVGGLGRYLAERLTVSSALVLLLLLLLKACRLESMPGSIPVLALGLGSILLPYSTLLYTHVPAAMLLFGCYLAQRKGSFTLSTILGALAVSYEYTLIVPFLVLLAYRRREYWSPESTALTAAVLLLFFLPQLLHNWIAFGNPFSTGYGLEAHGDFPVVSRGFFGFTFPSLRRLCMILLSPERGIFFYMPWAALGLWGLVEGKDLVKRLRSDPVPLLVVSYIILYSAQNAATAGWAYGQRYLIPVIPFLALGLGRFVSGSGSRKGLALLTVLPGIVLALLGVFGEVHLPVHPVENPVPLPQLTISLEMMLRGHHSMWLAGTIGTAALSAAAIACWYSVMRRAEFRIVSLAWVPLWLLLALISISGDWGGKIDYYRGVLAEHRMEWDLAAEYYGAALEDENAPAVVRARLEYARSMTGPD